MSPRILFLDIETSPILGYTWRAYDDNVLEILEPSRVICVGWKWSDEDSITCRALPDYKGYKPGSLDDSKLVKDVWSVLDEADVVIAHNGDSFDVKKLNYRFIVNGLNAPSTYQTVDTCKVAKKYFKFDKNNLDELGRILGEGEKVNTGGFSLWSKCLRGDEEAWAHMVEYNIGDVELLEKVYLRLRPFMEKHPNLNVLVNAEGKGDGGIKCPACLSERMQKRGFSITQTGSKQRYQCKDCGSWSSGPFVKTKGTILR